MALQLRFVSHSEVGLVRKNNQDSGYASPRLLVVADGMGGAAAGDLASAVAIDVLRPLGTAAEFDENSEGQQMLEALSEAIHRANDRIADLVEDDYSLEGMGTTLTGFLFNGRSIGLAHIGDSRAYLLRDDTLRRLTHDHSWVQSLIDDGRISADEAATHPHRSLLIKVLNGHPSNEPDLQVVEVRASDRLMICSDGVCGLLDDDAIGSALRLPELSDALARLVSGAHDAGGIDNITVIVADVVSEGGSTQAFVLGAATERALPPAPARERSDDVEDTIVLAPPTGSRTASVSKDAGSTAAATTTVATGTDAANNKTAGNKTAGNNAVAVREDEARYNPQLPHRQRLRRTILAVLLALVVVGTGLGAAYAWTRTQYYVGADDDRVAIFRGLADPVPGLTLSQVYEVQDLTIEELPQYYQAKVRETIEVLSLAAARQTVNELAAAARRCSEGGERPSTGGTPSSSAAPDESPSSTRSPVQPSPSSSSNSPSGIGSVSGPPSGDGSATAAPPADDPTTEC